MSGSKPNKTNTSWFQNVKLEIETYFAEQEQFSEAELIRRGVCAIDAFHDLFCELTSELRIRDACSPAHCRIDPFIPFQTGIIERFEKTGLEITMGISIRGWFIESWLVNSDHIRHMKDDFWAHILKLSELGEVEHSGAGIVTSSFSANERKLAQHKGSLVFSLVRDYTLSTLKDGMCAGLGSIHITRPLDSNECDVRAFFRSALEAFFRANYLLYRSAEIERHRVYKRFLKERSGGGTDAS